MQKLPVRETRVSGVIPRPAKWDEAKDLPTPPPTSTIVASPKSAHG